MAIPIFRAAHIGIDHGAIDLAVEAASVGDLFHCGIFQNLVVPGEHQLKLRYVLFSEVVGVSCWAVTLQPSGSACRQINHCMLLVKRAFASGAIEDRGIYFPANISWLNPF